MRKPSHKSAVAGVDVGAALASLPGLTDAVRAAMNADPKWEDERTETDALLAGLEPILTKAVRSTDPDYVSDCARQALVLLGKVSDIFQGACQDIPRAEWAMSSIGDMQSLLGSNLGDRDDPPSAGSTEPAAAKQDWREQTRCMLQQVEDAIDGAMHIRPSDCAYTFELLQLARDLVVEIDDAVAGVSVTRYEVQGRTITLEALLMGVREMSATPAATRMLMGEAMRIVEATVSECLDVLETE
jgi:hypothetical protein